MSVKKTFNIAITSFLCVMPIITMDLQPILQDTAISQDDQNEYEVIVEGNASYGNKPITGKACVVMNSKQLKKKKVGKGDIVIAPEIHSTWYSELMDVSGIIIEKGDDTSHAIALGKKLDIPVIVGASDATKKIINGQTITCDPITRNVYHIAYADSHHIHFDTLAVPARGEDPRSLYEKITKPNEYSSRLSREYSNKSDKSDKYVSLAEDRTIQVVENVAKYKPKHITKSVYRSHLERFKTFVLDMQSTVNNIRDYTPFGCGDFVILKGAAAKGCDSFSVDCIPLSFSFFRSNKEHVINVIESVASDYFIRYMDTLLDRCSKKPRDLNWVAHVAHEEHVKSINLPANVQKERLLSDPKEYKKIENEVDKDAREARIVAGLFARYWVENKLPL